MLNLHDRVAALLQQQLPANTTLVDAVSSSATTSVVTVAFNGKRYPINLPKLNVNTMFDNRRVSIMAKPGERINDVVKRLSEEQRLYLLPGIDYDFGEEQVAYEDQPSIMLQIDIAENSVVAYGRLSVVLKDPAAFPLTQSRENQKVVKTPLLYEHLALALASKVFDFGKTPTLEDTISASMAKEVIAYLKACRIPLQDDAQKALTSATIFSVVHDGISYLVGVKLKAGITYLLRVAGEPEAVTE